MKKFLTVLLIGLVVNFITQPIMLQAEESVSTKVGFSLTEEYSAPLVIPTVFKLDSIMLQNTKTLELTQEQKGAQPFIFISFAIVVGFCFGSLIQTR